jgi:tRNA pseudouridine55 synthase
MLRRVQAGPFKEVQAASLMALEQLQSDADAFEALDALLQPVDCALLQLPKVVLADSAVFYMLRGNAVMVSPAPANGIVRMYSDGNEFLGIGEILDDGRVGPKRLIATN